MDQLIVYLILISSLLQTSLSNNNNNIAYNIPDPGNYLILKTFLNIYF
jgi:hypothetical protein